jgi:predicted deacylase
MTFPDALDCFAASYAEARAKFQLAVARAEGQLSTYVHPSARGPDGGSLAIDVACFGPADAARAFLIVSGTHGGEGYTGSAAQIALLGTGALARLPGDTRVVLLHAINPYGFAHRTRTTENNVDLNRNFVDFSARLPHNGNSTPGSRATASRRGCRRS